MAYQPRPATEAKDLRPNALHPLVRCRLPVVWRFRRRGRTFVVFKHSRDLAEKSLLFLSVLRVIRVFLNRGFAGARCGRRQGLAPAAKNLGKETFHSFLCVTGLAWLR